MEELYKIILVDDEDDIRGRISSMITDETGFKVVASASNGYDALELIEEHKPHAVITDIRMPYIDGLALAEEIKTEFPKVKVAFLTGYGEFDYARKAVELSVVSYLMKPVIKKDVLDYLMKLKRVLDEEYELINNRDLLNNNFLKNKQMFIEVQFNEFLKRSELTTEDLSLMKLFDVDFCDSSYIVGLIEFFNSDNAERVKAETFIREFLRNATPQYELVIPFYTSSGLAFIIKNDELYLSEVELSMDKLEQSKSDHDDVKIRIALSSIFDDMKFYPKKFQEAYTVLETSRFTNRGCVVSYDNMEDNTQKTTRLSPDNIKEIENIVRFGSVEEINNVFNKYIALSKTLPISDSAHQLFMISCSNLIMNYAFSLGIEFNDYYKNGFMNDLLNLLSIEDILEYTKQEIIKLRDIAIKETNTKLTEITDQVISYIDLNYTDNSINLDKVAEHFNVSVSYLSSLLKKEKGISFNKYLIGVRIDKAKELLKYSDLKVAEVAKQVGYNDVYYFSHSFKKNTKTSPKEYRES